MAGLRLTVRNESSIGTRMGGAIAPAFVGDRLVSIGTRIFLHLCSVVETVFP